MADAKKDDKKDAKKDGEKKKDGGEEDDDDDDKDDKDAEEEFLEEEEPSNTLGPDVERLHRFLESVETPSIQVLSPTGTMQGYIPASCLAVAASLHCRPITTRSACGGSPSLAPRTRTIATPRSPYSWPL